MTVLDGLGGVTTTAMQPRAYVAGDTSGGQRYPEKAETE